jgi:HAD superfamily hydrolase (TIGR01450 family)
LKQVDEIPEITIDQILERYAVLLLDAYGVLVHSTGALPGASEFIDRLKRSGKAYYLLTNDASKLPETAAARYCRFGLPLDAERIITSGTLLQRYFAEHQLAGARCVVLGPQDSRRYVEMAGGRVVSATDRFEVLVICDEAGFSFLETVDAVLTGLFYKIERQETFHLVLANPDVIYPKADGGFGITSGSIAIILEAALQRRYPNGRGMRFVRLGKPEAAIFEEALRRSGTRDMVMIGDQLETDIRGADAFGLDSVWIAGGVSSAQLPAVRPTYWMPPFSHAR